MVLLDISFDIEHGTLDYTVVKPSGDIVIEGLTLAGTETWSADHKTLTYTASEVFIAPGAAADMDRDLGTDAFLDPGLFGSFTTTFTLR
jgi:hypothetical protein